MLDSPHKIPAEPRAAERPSTSAWHGTELVDDFAWLKAANWQEVMRDPQRLDPAIRRLSRSRERLCRRAARRHRRVAGRAVRRDEGPHQGGRFQRARRRTGPMPISLRYREGGQHPADLPAAARRRRRARSCSTATRSRTARRSSSSARTSHSPDHRCSAWSCRRERLGILHRAACATSRPAPISPTSSRTMSAAGRVDARRHGLLLRAARRQPSAVPACSATGSARPEPTMCASSHEPEPALFHLALGVPVAAASPRSRCTITRRRNPG